MLTASQCGFGPSDTPEGVNETDPDLDGPLPSNLPIILKDMGAMKNAIEEHGAIMAVASFKWLAYEGMKLDTKRDIIIYRYLNETYWPFTYAHMRRIADFQNRVFNKYATLHGLWYLDFADHYPDDSRLFTDAIHMTYEGARLKGWIMFNQLVLKLEKAIADGRLPQPDRRPFERYPEFTVETGTGAPADFRSNRCVRKNDGD